MKKLQFLIALALFSTMLQAQQPPIKISWTGELNCGYCQLDSVVVTKKATGEQVVFRYPDTVLMYSGDVRITPPRQEQEMGLKTYPNPFSDKAVVEFSLVQAGAAELVVYDMLGREVVRQRNILEKGTHRFSVDLPNGMYSLSLQTETGKQSVRLLSEGGETTAPQIVYASTSPNPSKRGEEPPPFGGNEGGLNIPSFGGAWGGLPQKSDALPFQYGDELILQGFISDSNVFQYKVAQTITLTEDTAVTFAFISMVDTVDIVVIELDKSYCCYDSVPYLPFTPETDISEDIWIGDSAWNIAITSNDFLFITTQAQLDSLFACTNSVTPPIVDFEKQCLLLAKGFIPSLVINRSPLSFIQLYDGHFILQADMTLATYWVARDFSCMVLINRPLSKEQISMRINFKH
jgi:hypothetical protein